MEFNSSLFLVWIFPIFLLLYLLEKKQWRNKYLLFVSILFYAWSEPKFIFAILFTTFLDFHLVNAMSRIESSTKRTIFLVASISINIGLLVYFKYFNFFIESFNYVLKPLGVGELSYISYLLPLGISFYTFETITYVVDVYRKEHKPQQNFSDYLLYILLFPKMVAGPIIRYSEIASQIEDRSSFETTQNRLNGFYRFCLGLSKKELIANQLAYYYVDKIFYINPTELDGPTAWLGIIAYTFQIYFDFSGYSDMAIGLGRMIGFKFPENFDNPYISTSITEFWRRWHITLGKWMKNYIYIPLGGNQKGTGRTYLNLWIVFILSGLWHKGSWCFILWGIYHGSLLVMERLFIKKEHSDSFPKVILTFILIAFGSVLFRIDNISEAFDYYKALFFSNNNSFIFPEIDFWIPFFLAIIFSFWGFFKFGKQLQNIFYTEVKENSLNILLTISSCILFVISLSYITQSGFYPFIYFRF